MLVLWIPQGCGAGQETQEGGAGAVPWLLGVRPWGPGLRPLQMSFWVELPGPLSESDSIGSAEPLVPPSQVPLSQPPEEELERLTKKLVHDMNHPPTGEYFGERADRRWEERGTGDWRVRRTASPPS